MTSDSDFDFNRFVELNGAELEDYAGRLLASPASGVSVDMCKTLRDRINTLDTEHLVLAIEMITRVSPADFYRDVVSYLQCTESSVFFAAYRSISQIPSDCLTRELIQEIEACPPVDLYSINPRTRERVDLGSTAKALATLLAEVRGRVAQTLL